MVSDVTLNPQRTPQGQTRDVPTIRPEQIQAPSLRGIPSVRATGFEQGAQAYSSIGAQARQTASDIVSFATGLQAERAREQEQEAQEARRELEIAAKLQEMGIEIGSLSSVNMDLAANLDNITTENDGNPELIAQRFQIQLDEKTKHMDEDVAAAVKTVQAARANPLLEAQRAQAAQRAAIEAQGETAQYQDFLEEEMVKYAVPETDEEAVALKSSTDQYMQSLMARADLSPLEKEMYRARALQATQQRVGVDFIANSGSPTVAAVNLFTGNTGIPEIDNIPITQRAKIFSQSQGLLNVLNQQANQAQAAANRAREAGRVAQRKQALANARSENPEIAAHAAEQLFNTAQTQGEVNQAIGLIEYVEGKEKQPWVESDPELKFVFEQFAASGAITPDRLQELASDAAGNGLSGDDAFKIIQEAEEIKDTLVTSPEYKTAMIQAKTVFPEALLPDADTNPFALLQSGQFGANASDEGRRQQELFNAFAADLRTKATTGQFTDGESLQNYAEKQLARYGQLLNTNIPRVPNAVKSDVREFDASKLEASERAAYTKAVKDEKIVSLANKRYLDNPRQIAQDWKDGLIDDATARKLQAVLMPKAREAK